MDYIQWQVENGRFHPVAQTKAGLPAGSYTVQNEDCGGISFVPHPLLCDDVIIIPDSPMKDVLTRIMTFWKSRFRYDTFGLIYKRAFLFHGPPGGGKTMMIRAMMQQLIEMGGIVIFSSHPGLTTVGLQTLRAIEPDRPVIVVIEDIDQVIKRTGEHHLLQLLDGENQIDNIVCLATTNRIEALSASFTNRPSRFDEPILIPMPSVVGRKAYLTKIAGKYLRPEEVTRWAQDTEGLSLAHLRDLVVSVHCLECSYDTVLRRLRAMCVKQKDDAGFDETENSNEACELSKLSVA